MLWRVSVAMLSNNTIQFDWRVKVQESRFTKWPGKTTWLSHTAHKMWDSSRREEATWFVCDGLCLGSDMKTKRLKGESWKQKWASLLLWYEIQIWRVEYIITQFFGINISYTNQWTVESLYEKLVQNCNYNKKFKDTN